MRKIFIGLTALLLVASSPEVARLAAQATPTKGSLAAGGNWVRGSLVCRTCYLKDKANAEMTHYDVPEYDEGTPDFCAKVCSMKGMPLALLTDEGELYTLTGKLAARGDVLSVERRVIRANEPNAALVNHLTHTIIVAGVVSNKNGELILDADRFDWNMDTKDHRVGSTVETKHTEGHSVAKPRDPRQRRGD